MRVFISLKYSEHLGPSNKTQPLPAQWCRPICFQRPAPPSRQFFPPLGVHPGRRGGFLDAIFWWPPLGCCTSRSPKWIILPVLDRQKPPETSMCLGHCSREIVPHYTVPDFQTPLLRLRLRASIRGKQFALVGRNGRALPRPPPKPATSGLQD